MKKLFIALIMTAIIVVNPLVNALWFPSGAFISGLSSFAYEKSVMTTDRCNNIPPSVGISNPTHAEVEFADATVKVIGVDNSINNMHIGKTATTGVNVIQTSDCDVFNSVCTGSPVTAFQAQSGISIDGACSFTYNIKFKQPTISTTSPIVDNSPLVNDTQVFAAGCNSIPKPPSCDRIPVVSDIFDGVRIVFEKIIAFISQIFHNW